MVLIRFILKLFKMPLSTHLNTKIKLNTSIPLFYQIFFMEQLIVSWIFPFKRQCLGILNQSRTQGGQRNFNSIFETMVYLSLTKISKGRPAVQGYQKVGFKKGLQ